MHTFALTANYELRASRKSHLRDYPNWILQSLFTCSKLIVTWRKLSLPGNKNLTLKTIAGRARDETKTSLHFRDHFQTLLLRIFSNILNLRRIFFYKAASPVWTCLRYVFTNSYWKTISLNLLFISLKFSYDVRENAKNKNIHVNHRCH